MKKNNRKGFTLAELLIVVAIIAVLIAIAIPVFTTQLEKSRETADLANLRSAYAAGVVYAMTENPENGSMWYAPAVDGALDDESVALGQGTAADGKASLDGVVGVIDYANNTAARGKGIQITFTNGMVSKVAFA